jgi:diguanylate cyclase (GGDEF)-like protein/PAS domain S-box-containing protein
MKPADRRALAKPLMWSLTAVGATCFLFSVYRLNLAALDLRFFVLALATVTIGPRLLVDIPRVKSRITVSETFIFLTMLLFGGEAAILIATFEALGTSLRCSKKVISHFFNMSVIACSYFLTVWVLRLCFGSILLLPTNGTSSKLVLAICLMSVSQYVANSGLVAICFALQSDQPIWRTWQQNYLYTSVTYVAGASTAMIVAKLISRFGFYPVLAAAPIVAIVYFTYYFYLKNVEAKTAQVEQAERHVAELSHHIAEQERISKALRESEEHFRNAFDYAAIGMALVSPAGQWLQVNHSLSGIVGFSEQELLATTFQSLTHPDDLETDLLHINQLLKGEIPTYHLEKRYFHKLGHPVWVLSSVSLIKGETPNSLRFIFQIQDITDRKRAEARLLHDAFHDALTGLPNRALFIDHLRLAVERSKRKEKYVFAVLFLDLDRFKVINDSLGHMVGDQLLVGMARRLEGGLRPGDTVARLGGDEFTVLLEDINDTEEIIQVADRLQKELTLPFHISGHEVFTTVSIGIAPSTLGYDQPETLLRDADTAMYRAKVAGKARHEIFDKAMHDSAMDLLQLETDLRRAVDREEFVVHYQPIVEIESGTLYGFEALVRWQHPERGLILPDKFISVAEETGLISVIGERVLRESCRQMSKWQKEFVNAASLSISVNLSSKQFTQPNLIEQINKALQETQLNPESLKLEITESVVMENVDTATGMLKRIRELGVKLSIDDFGTGYSSLSCLPRFPIDTLKIDRSFVGQMSDNAENAEIVRTIVMLARTLGMDVVAEGVETNEQLELLKALDCELGQGFLFSEALDSACIEDSLSRNQPYGLLDPRLNEIRPALAA